MAEELDRRSFYFSSELISSDVSSIAIRVTSVPLGSRNEKLQV